MNTYKSHQTIGIISIILIISVILIGIFQLKMFCVESGSKFDCKSQLIEEINAFSIQYLHNNDNYNNYQKKVKRKNRIRKENRINERKTSLDKHLTQLSHERDH